MALLVFTIGGVSTHEPDSAEPIGNVIRTLAPLAIAWFITAVLIGVYRADVIGSPRRAVGRALIASPVANPLAVVLRAYLIERAAIPQAARPDRRRVARV